MTKTESALLEFVETRSFTKRIEELASREMLLEIQSDLVENPIRWPVIQGTHGARKGRIADPAEGRGRSGSFRYLYLYLPHVQRIYLLFLFAKDEQGNLSSDQKKRIAQWCTQIREEV